MSAGPPDAAGQPGRTDDLERALLGARRLLRRREVSAAAGVSLLSARRFWRALGFPNVADPEEAFTDRDVGALRGVVDLVRDGLLDDATALGLARSMGRHADRLANWQVQLLAEEVAAHLAERAGGAVPDPRETARRTADLLVELVDRTEPLLVYAWRRHLASTVTRLLADAEDAADAAGSGGDPAMLRSVAFADLVAFTRAVRRMPERDLAVLVQRFEAVTSDIVSAHGGRVVKTVGDEVFFLAGTAPEAGRAALDIAEALADDADLPDVRVGMATGHVVARLGDVYGDTVNRASRLTGAAAAGTVLVDAETARLLAPVPGFAVAAQSTVELPGLGRVDPHLLTRGSTNDEGEHVGHQVRGGRRHPSSGRARPAAHR